MFLLLSDVSSSAFTFSLYWLQLFLQGPLIILISKMFFFPSVNRSPTGIVPCPATPTTFGHIRTANGQGQQRRRITSIQPPTGLQEWLRTFQVSTLKVFFYSFFLFFLLTWATLNPRAKSSSKSRCCAQSMFT